MSDPISTNRRLATILAADVVGYSRLMELDEVGTLTTLKALRKDILEPLVARHQGRVFKITGDAVMIEFSSPVNAVQCAIELQLRMAEANSHLPDDRQVNLRIGINLGDVLIEGSDLYGDGVNIAARLERIAEPGGILISGSTYDHVTNKVRAQFDDLGIRILKNIAKPMHVYRATGTPRVAVPPGACTADKPAIAVLPFANMSEDPDQDYFSDAITENIITGLSRFRDLVVIASNSTFAYKGRAVKVQEASRELGARYILEGSVQRIADCVRITARLIDGTTGRHLWAERYDRGVEDIFAVQDEVTELIVGTLATSYGGRLRKAWQNRGEGGLTRNMLALDYFHRGMECLHSFTKDDNERARELFHQSAQLDPSYAKPLSKISWTHMLDATFGWSENAAASLEKGLEFAKAAIELDDDEAWGHHALAGYHMFNRRYDQAINAFEKAVSLNPNDPDTLTDFGWCLNYSGQAKEGLELARKAVRLNPHCPEWYIAQLGQIYFDARQYAEAIATLAGLRDLDTVPIRLTLAASHAALGQNEEAQKAIQRVFQLDPQATLDQWTGPERAPYKEPRDLEHFRDHLRKAGLPQ
ncbi:MAG: adenylate/guanylate cyclase domain-containing protein [Dongiaceae bacterium]